MSGGGGGGRCESDAADRDRDDVGRLRPAGGGGKLTAELDDEDAADDAIITAAKFAVDDGADVEDPPLEPIP